MKRLIFIIAAILFAFQVSGNEPVKKLDSLMNLFHDHNNFSGSVLVAQNGEILFSGGYGYANIEHHIVNSEQMKYRVASISKQFTSMLILQKVSEGKMKLDAPIRDYIPDYPAPQGDVITIHHLMSHTSGMPHYAGIPNFFNLYGRQLFEHRDFVELFWDLDLMWEPGARYSYSSFGYYLLGYILEEVSKKRFADLLDEKILHPLGMYESGIEDHRKIIRNRASGYDFILNGFIRAEFRDLSTALATGDMYTTPLDMVLWDEALSNYTLLEKQYQDLIFKPNLNGYGYGWNVGYRKVNENDSIYYNQHTGGTNGFTSIGTRLPEDGYYILVFCNTRPGEIRSVEQNIVRVLYGEEIQFTPSVSIAASRIMETEGLQQSLDFLKELSRGNHQQNGFNLQPISSIVSDLISLRRTYEATAFAQLGTEIFPESAQAHMLLGDAFRADGQEEEAIKSYARALLINPSHRQSLLRLGR